MSSKTQAYLELANRTANGITRHWEHWANFLTAASRLYKYNFADQLMIYAQRPDATACASFDLWNNRMQDWKFENDAGCNPQMKLARQYVEYWTEMQKKNTGLLIWGGVGTGKSFFAGCIANALMEREVPVCMTNFARILNELNNSFSGRNEVVERLCRYPLLIIDDFGMERDTNYALEQVYNIIDSRYRSKRPLIITTNLTLDEIRHPQDVAHARIYDRVLEMCVPVSCFGTSIRKDTAQEKLNNLKSLIG